MSHIAIFDWQLDQTEREQFRRYCDRIFDEAFLTNHSLVREFEKQLSTFCGLSWSIATASGTSALECTLKALNVAGKKVIIPTNTFIATATAVLNAGAIPVILDVEPEYFSLCPDSLEQALEEFKDVAAVVTVHIGGLISPTIETIAERCKAYGVPLVEDAAHAFGCKLGGTPAGGFGTAGCLSFFLTKVLTTGEGGAVVSNQSEFQERIISARQFGKSDDNPLVHESAGTNGKMSEFQAALGLVELGRVKERISKRQEIALRYQKNLAGSAWRAISPPSSAECSYYKQIVLCPVPRPLVRRSLQQANIALTGGVYEFPLHRQPVLSLAILRAAYPVAESFADSHICPPCYPEVTVEDVDRVCDILLKLSRF